MTSLEQLQSEHANLCAHQKGGYSTLRLAFDMLLKREAEIERLDYFIDKAWDANKALEAENADQALLLKGAVQRGGELIADVERIQNDRDAIHARALQYAVEINVLREQLAEKEAQLEEMDQAFIHASDYENSYFDKKGAYFAALNEHRRPDGCKCDFRTYMLGDGCDICNPAKALEYAREEIQELTEQLAEKEGSK